MNENKRKGKDWEVLGPGKKTKKTVEYEGNGDSICCWCTWNGLCRYGNGTGRMWNQENLKK